MSGFTVKIDGVQTDLFLADNFLTYILNGVENSIKYEDIIGIEASTEDRNKDTFTRKIIYISPSNNKKLVKKTLQLTAGLPNIDTIGAQLKDILKKVEGRPKNVVVFLNPIGGSANGVSLYKNQIEPVFKLAEIEAKLVVSEKADHFKELSESFDFSQYEALVIVGGDGTANEILNGLIRRKQRSCEVDINDRNVVLKTVDIPIAFIPAGTGNGLATAAHGCIDVTTATLHIIKGKTRLFPVFGNYVENQLIGYSQLMTGYGMYGDLMYLIDTYRWLRKLRYIFIPFWFFMVKTLRSFDGEITLEYLDDDETNSGGKIEKLELNLTSVFSVTIKQAFFADDVDPENRHFPVLVYKPCTRYGILKHFFSLYGRITKESVERCEFVDLHFVKSVTIKVPKSESDLDLIVNIDGEIFKLSKPELHFRLIKDAYRIFSALETDQAG